MYDEFKIKSLKAKIMLVMGDHTGQFQLNTAFDRNGKLFVPCYKYGENEISGE